MENKLCDLESLPDLFNDTGDEIYFVHSTSNESSDVSFIRSLRKLNAYNLSAYYTPTKQVYYAFWSENLSGRSGNDIASAFHKTLTVLAEENVITELITWSDSFVPQKLKFHHFKLSSTTFSQG
ncbi:hypothetical protein AVEN_101779-1 [Araneus ventricosus]|uniref:Uncharacterized protein n=1 Tax=Araneus ventricosus TaxID=182803 RepID=A0A4Y2D0U3_ARAVE|nr:hypothetical protein AVEN_101779-1 [Araneus ventricosus]